MRVEKVRTPKPWQQSTADEYMNQIHSMLGHDKFQILGFSWFESRSHVSTRALEELTLSYRVKKASEIVARYRYVVIF